MGVLPRNLSLPAASPFNSLMDLTLSQLDEIEHRMKTWGTVTGSEHGYCKTQEHLYACTPVDGED